MTPTRRRTESRYPIQAVAARTGLAPALLRAWERRYQAVEPTRSEAGERLYSDQQVHRLNLLRMLTQHGHRISRIAQLPAAELERLLLDVGISPFHAPVRAENADLEHLLYGRGLAAVRAVDPELLATELERARAVLSPMALIDSVLRPLIRECERISVRGPVIAESRASLMRVLSKTSRELASLTRPIGSGRPLLVWAIAGIRSASAAMAAATVSMQGLRPEYVKDDDSPDTLGSQLGADAVPAVVVTIARSLDLGAALQALRRARAAAPASLAILCAVHDPDEVAAVDQIVGVDVCSTYRELAELIDASRS